MTHIWDETPIETGKLGELDVIDGNAKVTIFFMVPGAINRMIEALERLRDSRAKATETTPEPAHKANGKVEAA